MKHAKLLMVVVFLCFPKDATNAITGNGVEYRCEEREREGDEKAAYGEPLWHLILK